MKWDFFYDEDDDKSYETVQEWYEDNRHLLVPTIVLVVLGILIFICLHYFQH